MKFENFFQNAYVTRDLDEAVAIFREQHDVQAWVFLEPDMTVRTARGEGPAHVRVAMGWVGNYMVEVIQPISGLIHHYLDFLPADHTPRFHHIAMRTFDWEKTRAEIDRLKLPVAYEGSVPGCNFIYIDALQTLGHYVEYVWAEQEMWKAIGGPG
jgi:hypothetical protein